MNEWIQLPEEIVRVCREAADIIKMKVGNRASTLNLNSDRDFIGNCGEAVFAIATGRPMPDFIAKATGEGDGGEDFPGIDVKTTTWVQQPALLVAPDKKTGSTYCRVAPDKVSRFALVAYDKERGRGRYCGWATKEEIFAAPVKTNIPYPAHHIPEGGLHHGDPDSEP